MQEGGRGGGGGTREAGGAVLDGRHPSDLQAPSIRPYTASVNPETPLVKPQNCSRKLQNPSIITQEPAGVASSHMAGARPSSAHELWGAGGATWLVAGMCARPAEEDRGMALEFDEDSCLDAFEGEGEDRVPDWELFVSREMAGRARVPLSGSFSRSEESLLPGKGIERTAACRDVARRCLPEITKCHKTSCS